MRRAPLAFALASLAVPSLVHAGGLEYPDVGSQAGGRAGAFTARADDATAFWHNPAGLAKLAGYQLALTVTLNFPNLTFTRSGTYPQSSPMGPVFAYENQPFPTVSASNLSPGGIFGFTAQIMERLTLGFGVGAPSAVGDREYPATVTVAGVTAPAPQRYDNISNNVLVAFPTLSAGYRISPKLDVGAGFMWGFARIKSKNGVWGTRNPTEDPGQDATTTVNVHDNFIPAFNLGVLFRPTPKLELGASFRMGAHIDATGTIEGHFGPTLAATGTQLIARSPCTITTKDTACAEVTANLPAEAHVGARYIMRDALGNETGDVEADLAYDRWSSFDAYSVHTDGTTPIVVEDQLVLHKFKDTFGVRVGGSHSFGKLAARGGFAFDSAAVPKAYSRVDADAWSKITLAAGVSYAVKGMSFDLGAAYVYDFAPTVGVGQGQVRPLLPVESFPPPDPQPNVVNEGKYSAHNIAVALGLRISFDELSGKRAPGTSVKNPYRVSAPEHVLPVGSTPEPTPTPAPTTPEPTPTTPEPPVTPTAPDGTAPTAP